MSIHNPERGWKDVHQHGFWAPIVQERDGAWRWFVPVESGHTSFVRHFDLTEKDARILRTSQRRAILLLGAIWSRLQIQELSEEDFRRAAHVILHGKDAGIETFMQALDSQAQGQAALIARSFGLDISERWIPTPPKPGEQDLLIETLGAQGDGRADLSGVKVSVPLTLAGERVRVRINGERGELVELIDPSQDRVPPPCPAYGKCGGCALQHMHNGAYASFKKDLIARALKARGLEAPVAEAWITPRQSRRRAVFSAARLGQDMVLGFHARKSHEVIDVEQCEVVRPALLKNLMFLRYLSKHLAPQKGALSLHVSETDSGLDLVVSGVERAAAQLTRMELASEALRSGFARVTIEGTETLTATRPVLKAGTAQLLPVPGGFLQASAEAEAHMAALVLAHLKSSQRVIDLFAGIGTFTLRLAAHAKVHGVEGGKAACDALTEASRLPGLKPVTTEARDLFRSPVSAQELGAYDGAVLDPPRAGAEAQAAQLAQSRIARLAYVSCDEATLARDLRTLVNGGYRIEVIHPVDQFLWSAHIESVALLSRPG
jgi:23S rRNA (uracil1939-C5)-methyltransferase